MILNLQHNYTGLNINKLEKVPVGICCIALFRVYELKPYIDRKELINNINIGKIKAYCTKTEVFLSESTYNTIKPCQQRYFTQNVKAVSHLK